MNDTQGERSDASIGDGRTMRSADASVGDGCGAVVDALEGWKVEGGKVEGWVEGGNGRARSPSGPQPGGPRSVAAAKGLLAAALLAALAGGAWWWLGGRNGTAGTNVTTRTAKAPASDVSSVPDVPSPAPRNGECRTFTLPGGATMEMIYVAPGSFTMGSPSSEDGHEDDETQHRVTLTKGYWLGKYEVTQRQWESVMGDNPSIFKGPDRPVESISWDDCQKFIEKVDAASRRQLGGEARLPTEAEWEYACRAGTVTAYSWGDALNGDKANCDGNYPCGTTVKGRYRQETADVGSYSPNAWGFYDMHGNVWEWCSDWYGSYEGDATNPTGAASGVLRVLRGGGWLSLARSCRSALRYWFRPGDRDDDCGFRLCCSAGPRGGAEQ